MSVGVIRLSGMDSELSPTFRNIVRQQHGVVSRSQALRAGLSADMVKSRIRSGWWRPVHHGVYVTFTGVPGHGAQLWAALLGAGPGAVLSHETAAELQRLTDKPADSIHVTIPWQRRIKVVEGVSLHRCTRAGQVVGYGRPPRTKVEETVLDLAHAAATFDEVCGWVTRAFARDLTDAARLGAAMALRSRLRWRDDLHELITAASSGDHSVLEYRYGRDVERAHGLPESVRQAPFKNPDGRRGRRDRLYRDYGVVVELDGRLAHPAEAKWRDKARDNAAAVDGQQTLRYEWPDVTRRSCETAAQIAQVLRVHGWKGRPRPCSPGCPVALAFADAS